MVLWWRDSQICKLHALDRGLHLWILHDDYCLWNHLRHCFWCLHGCRVPRHRNHENPQCHRWLLSVLPTIWPKVRRLWSRTKVLTTTACPKHEIFILLCLTLETFCWKCFFDNSWNLNKGMRQDAELATTLWNIHFFPKFSREWIQV